MFAVYPHMAVMAVYAIVDGRGVLTESVRWRLVWIGRL